MKTTRKTQTQKHIPPETLETARRAARQMGLSLEIWNGHGRPTWRLNLASSCATCEVRQVKLFDRCRKRRSYLTRTDATSEQAITEKCPARIRLARLGPAPNSPGPVFFAFGYDPTDLTVEKQDEKVISFLSDVQQLVGGNPAQQNTLLDESPMPEQEGIALLTRVSGEPGHLNGLQESLVRVLEEWREALKGEFAVLWRKDSSIIESTSATPALEMLNLNTPQWLATFHRFSSAFEHSTETAIHEALTPNHPVLALSPEVRFSVAMPLRLNGELLGVVYGLRSQETSVLPLLQQQLVTSLTGQLALTLSNAKLYSDLKSFLMNTVRSLVSAIDAKDSYTSGHSERVNIISMLLGHEMDLDLEDLEALYWGALLHDVGKIGMPETILNKPAHLDDSEVEIVREHPERGWEMVHNIEPLKRAADGVRYHHERWDGKGYPEALVGETIPVIARIICVADTFDAIVSNRSYRKGQSPTRALEIIEESANEQFDPMVVEALASLLPLLEKHQWVLMSGQKVYKNY